MKSAEKKCINIKYSHNDTLFSQNMVKFVKSIIDNLKAQKKTLVTIWQC